MGGTVTVLGAAEPEPPAIPIAVDPRVELLAVVFRLAGNPEYNMGEIASYNADVDAHFGPFRDHSAVAMARRLREEKGVSFDAVMQMALHLAVAERQGSDAVFENADATLYERWEPDDAKAFVQELRRFAKEARFAAFFDAHRELYGLLETRMRAVVEEHLDAAWVESFFGMRPRPFTIFLGPGNGGGNYGPKVVLPDGGEELYAIIGVWKMDDAGLPTFNAGIVTTIVHEMTHSFVNPVVERHRQELEAAGEAIFKEVRPQMERLAYSNWKTVLDESLVRAVEVRYQAAHDDDDEAARKVAIERGLGFLWMDELAALLGEYEATRERHPSFEAFFPTVTRFFTGVAPRVTAMAEDFKKGRPLVVATVPPNGAEDVDPALTEFVVAFDRPMGSGVSIMQPGGVEHFPEVGKFGFDEGGKVFRMEVKLEPGRVYEMSFNSEAGGTFASAEGVPLEVYNFRFTTRPAEDP